MITTVDDVLKNIAWTKSIYHMSDKEIVQYYCQIWDNIKHSKDYVLSLRKRYQNEIGWNGDKI